MRRDGDCGSIELARADDKRLSGVRETSRLHRHGNVPDELQRENGQKRAETERFDPRGAESEELRHPV